jgi:hypothetical protein
LGVIAQLIGIVVVVTIGVALQARGERRSDPDPDPDPDSDPDLGPYPGGAAPTADMAIMTWTVTTLTMVPTPGKMMA